jgi:hypothetical protein
MDGFIIEFDKKKGKHVLTNPKNDREKQLERMLESMDPEAKVEPSNE